MNKRQAKIFALFEAADAIRDVATSADLNNPSDDNPKSWDDYERIRAAMNEIADSLENRALKMDGH